MNATFILARVIMHLEQVSSMTYEEFLDALEVAMSCYNRVWDPWEFEEGMDIPLSMSSVPEFPDATGENIPYAGEEYSTRLYWPPVDADPGGKGNGEGA